MEYTRRAGRGRQGMTLPRLDQNSEEDARIMLLTVILSGFVSA